MEKIQKRSYTKLKGFKYTEETDSTFEVIMAALINRARLWWAKKVANEKAKAQNNRRYHVIEHHPRVNVTYKSNSTGALSQRTEEIKHSYLLVVCNLDRKDLMRDGFLSKREGAYFEMAKISIYSTDKG